MKRYILAGLLLAGSFGFAGIFSFAQTVTDTYDGNPRSSCVNLTRPMSVGSKDSNTGGQVSDLQQFLQDNGYLGSDPTGYFGNLTRRAVYVFQSANGITPNGLVGPITRAAIKRISCSGDTSVVSPVPGTPIITLSSNTSIPYGGTTNITWNVTPSTGVTCVAAGGNLAAGTAIGTSGSWMTPNLYTTTEYGMRCTDSSTGLSATKYVTVAVAREIVSTTTLQMAEPILSSASPISQAVIGGSTMQIATFNFKTISSGTYATLRELRFSTSAAGSIESITVGGVTAPVVGNVATVSGLNMLVGSSGVDVPVTVRFAGFQNASSPSIAGGVLTASIPNVAINLTYAEATNQAGNVVVFPIGRVSSNTMTLVASKPTVAVASRGTTLAFGAENKIGEFTVTADANGKIGLSQVQLTVDRIGIDNFSFASPRVVSGASAIPEAQVSLSGNQVFVRFNSGYEILPGQSKTFSVLATVNGSSISSISGYVSSWLVREGFIWKDLVGGNTQFTGSVVYNFPTNGFRTGEITHSSSGPTVNLSTSAVSNKETLLTWSSENATKCTLTTGSAEDYANLMAPLSGTMILSFLEPTRNVKLLCVGSDGVTSSDKSFTIYGYSFASTSRMVLGMAVGNVPLDLSYDINRDGRITSADASVYLSTNTIPAALTNGDKAYLALRMSVGTAPVDLSYDLNNDGRVTSADALAFLRLDSSTSAPTITLSPDTTVTYGGTTNITWNVTPSTGVTCVAAGGNLAAGTAIGTSGSWTTPNLYTTTQYGMRCTNTNGLSTTKYVTVTVTPKSNTGTAPAITLSSNTSVPYGGTTNITWNVTPSTGVTCVAAGGNLANGTQMSTSGSWTTPNLYTTTEYGMRCTDLASGLNSYKYVTVSVTPSTAPQVTLSPDTTTSFGGTATLSWNVTPSTGVTCVSAGGNLANGTQMSTSGSWTTPNLYTTTQYGMRCTNTNGLSTTKYVTVVVPAQIADSTSASAPTITLSPDTTVTYGGTTNITWNVTPSTGVTCVAAGGNLAAGTAIGTSGSWMTPNLYTTTQYGMRCTNNSNGLTSYKYTTVTVTPASAPTVTLSPDTTVTYGGTTNITWNVTPSTGVTCVAAGGNLANGTQMSTSGSWTTPNLYTTTQYGMRCTNTNGLSTIKYMTVTVPAQTTVNSAAPTIILSPDTTIAYGGSTNITWNVTPSTGVTCVSAGGNLANGTQMSTSGSWTTPNLYTTTQYGMRCTNNVSGAASYKYINVSVQPQTSTVTTGTLQIYFNGDLRQTSYGLTRDYALSVCTTTKNNNPSTSIRCVWNGTEIFNSPATQTTSSTATSPTSTATDWCAAQDSSKYYTDECCTTNSGTQRCGTVNRSSDACLAYDASQYLTTQCCTTLTGVQRCGTKVSSASNQMQFSMVPAGMILGASTQCVDVPYNMHRGHESYAVTKLQEFLKSKNFLGEVTGFYGDKTVAAVKAYQGSRGLPVTGMVYDFTRQSIRAESCQ